MTGLSAKTEAALAEFIGGFYADPEGFVMAVWPWGSRMVDGIKVRIPGMETLPDGSPNPLIDWVGPERWQRRLLRKLGAHIRENIARAELGLQPLVFRAARASGHGVGKSALVAWIIYFLMSTRHDTRGVVTANTQFQLEDKTWPELAKWHNLAINKHWFAWAATSFYFKPYPEDRRKNYMTTAATVSEQKTEAFAGLHNEGRTVFIVFDEASGIPSKIWEVSEGALTDGEGFFFAFGNPTRPDGDFAECFDKHKDMYDTEQVDSREVTHTNKTALEDIIRKYGIDSDEVKVRILGQFPIMSFNGFIPPSIVDMAIERELTHDSGAPLIMAVDVARFGDDESVIGYRQGRDARSRRMKSFKGLTTVKLAEIVMQEANRERPDAIVVESTGPGAGVIDILRSRGYRVVEVHPGSAAVEHDKYANKRAEIWVWMRDWFIEQGCVADDPELYKQLTSILYMLDRHEQRIILEAKRDMKKRGLPSPDRADTLALTFAATVARRDANSSRTVPLNRQTITEYDPMTY